MQDETVPEDNIHKLVKLEKWRVIETSTRGRARHLVGFTTAGEGRVSSTIAGFDSDLKLIRTRTGRVYQLMGDPGALDDINRLIVYWCQLYEERRKIYDVTQEYLK